jgi:HemY protein
MLLTELMLAAEDFPGARRALDDVATRAPTQRSLAILAAISRGEGADDSIVRDLVARAIAAPRGPQWVCDKCQAIHDGWQPVCDNCGSFDTLSWKTPPAATTASPALAELLPLMDARPTPDPTPTDQDPLPLDEIARRAN